MIIVVTGADGFIGRNLRQHLAERPGVEVRSFGRSQNPKELAALVDGADFVFHLAGVNRPTDPVEFELGNVALTEALCRAFTDRRTNGQPVQTIVYASSVQAEQDNPYGRSKQAAERLLLATTESHGLQLRVFRLPNVFGKWARPNYNSAVATFCHNVSRDLPIEVPKPDAVFTLVHVDDVIRRFIDMLDGDLGEDTYCDIAPRYQTTVGQVAEMIRGFRRSRDSLVIDHVGTGLARALYATYVSYLPADRFAYGVPEYADARGVFVEMLKTRDSGQFSFFTAHPGVTRGGHYHHSKTEKFLVIHGEARFRFRHVQSGEEHELRTSGAKPVIVETVPGWTHDITNVGGDEMIVMLWANEIFDRSRPDTISCPL